MDILPMIQSNLLALWAIDPTLPTVVPVVLDGID